MFLQAANGRLVRLEGRLARSPSFWVKNVDIIRRYDRIHGAVVPVELESRADVRFLGGATLHMTYSYSSINGQPVTPRKRRQSSGTRGCDVSRTPTCETYVRRGTESCDSLPL
jgi:hypothetical protein